MRLSSAMIRDMPPRLSLRRKPLRNPGQPLDNELTRLRDDAGYGYLFFTGGVALLVLFGGYSYFFGMPRTAVIFTSLAAFFGLITLYKVWRNRRQAVRTRLNQESEGLVGQALLELRAMGARVIHDVPGDGFNLDHVVLCDRGVIVVETGIRSKSGLDPVQQVRAEVRWLSNLLEQLVGETLPVRGALVFPSRRRGSGPEIIRQDVWEIEPKALPAVIQQEPVRLSAEALCRASSYLSQYVRQRSGG